MEQLTKNQAVATSQEAVQNQNEPQLRDENAHNDKSVHGVLNPTYQAGLRRDAVQRSEERVSRNAETDLVCRLLLEKEKNNARANTINHSCSGCVELSFEQSPRRHRPNRPPAC